MNSLLVFFSVCIALASAAGSLQLGGYGAGLQHVQLVQPQAQHVQYVQQPHVQYVQQPMVQYVQQPQVQLQSAPLVHHSTYSSPIQTQQLVQVAAPARQIVQSQPQSYSYSYSSGIRRGVSSANNVKYVTSSSIPVQTTQVLQPTIGLGGYGGLGGSQILLGSGGYSGNTVGYPTYISSHK